MVCMFLSRNNLIALVTWCRGLHLIRALTNLSCTGHPPTFTFPLFALSTSTVRIKPSGSCCESVLFRWLGLSRSENCHPATHHYIIFGSHRPQPLIHPHSSSSKFPFNKCRSLEVRFPLFRDPSGPLPMLRRSRQQRWERRCFFPAIRAP